MYGFMVRFTQADGSIFAGAKGATLFDIFVGPDPDGNLKVVDLMIDLAAALKSPVSIRDRPYGCRRVTPAPCTPAQFTGSIFVLRSRRGHEQPG